MKKNKTQVIAEPGKQEIVVIREFEAPRELVFRAHTEPKLFARWFGCEGMTNTILEFEARSGGRYRVRQSVAGQPGEFALATNALESAHFKALSGGRTRLTAKTVFQSVADRDGMVKAGAEKGTGEAFERMDEVLEELKTT